MDCEHFHQHYLQRFIKLHLCNLNAMKYHWIEMYLQFIFYWHSFRFWIHLCHTGWKFSVFSLRSVRVPPSVPEILWSVCDHFNYLICSILSDSCLWESSVWMYNKRGIISSRFYSNSNAFSSECFFHTGCIAICFFHTGCIAICLAGLNLQPHHTMLPKKNVPIIFLDFFFWLII